MAELWSGNEAAARGLYEAGIRVGASYPGTPATEIFERLAEYEGLYCEWAPNEKVAAEVAYGASIGGVRAATAMKHVGLNVAADPLFTAAYNGVRGGYVVITADDPSMHSSQNEQDNRHYGRAAKIPVFEPADGQDTKDLMRTAFECSEAFDTPVLVRLTTRVCHSKSLVEPGPVVRPDPIPYTREAQKYVTTPANSYARRPLVEQRLHDLAAYAGRAACNLMEKKGTQVGVITAGIAALYAREVFPEDTSFYQLGLVYPLSEERIREFADHVDTLYVIEEGDPFIEGLVRELGISCHGRRDGTIPAMYELNPTLLRQALYPESIQETKSLAEKTVPRPPALCPGCPHRGLFVELRKIKGAVIAGDIGCYTLGAAPPLEAMDCLVCMGGGFTLACGLAKAFAQSGEKDRVVFGLVGDSTFFHSGMTGAVEIIYNGARVIPIVLDNATTAMTGQQDNPGSGLSMRRETASVVSIEKVLEAIGFPLVITVDPQDLEAVRKALQAALASEVPTAIVTRRPCVLIKGIKREKRKCIVDRDKCRRCKMCLKVACPAVYFRDGSSYIDPVLCVGCTVCLQVCPFGAIGISEEETV